MAHGARGPNKVLFAACAKGHVDAMRQLLDEGAEVNRANNGTTPLLMACMNGHADAARLLLDSGAEVDRATPSGATPLLNACWTELAAHVGWET